jgi:maintenance of morphology protein 1
VLIAQTIAQLREDARQDNAVLTSLTEMLNSGSKPDWIGEIRVSEIALGDEFPIFSNCRVMPAEDGFAVGGSSGGGLGSEEARLQARMDVDLSDVITLGVETTLVLNYPKPRTAVLPVALAVSVVRFSGTLAVSFIPSSSPPSTTTNSQDSAPNTPAPHRHNSPGTPRPSTASSAIPPHRPTTLAFTFLDDYRLDLSVRSLVGSRSRLQDVPKIAQLIESRLHAWFDERAVEPRFQQIALPSLWPRKRNTRGGQEEENDDVEDSEEATGVSPSPGVEQALPKQNGTAEPQQPRPSSSMPPSSVAASLEARLEAEGAKLREAEVRAGERRKERESDVGGAQGMRWRGDAVHQREQLSRQSSSRSADWSGQRGMPGAMPGG